MKAFSCILLLALKTWALNGQGKHFSSHHSRILGEEHAAGWIAGKRATTQSPASPGEHGAGQTQKPPLRTLSAGPAVLTPGALCRGSILRGRQGAWALPAASPCPEPPRRRRPARHSAPLPEPRADPQGCSAQPLRPSFSVLLLATAEALRGHCEARGWRHAGHVMTPPFLDLPGHRPQASSPRKRHLLGQGSPPAFSRSTVLCTRLCPRRRPLPAPPQGGCREACVCPSCCVSDTLSPRTRPSVRGRSSVDLNVNLEKTNKLQGNNEDGVSAESTHTRYFPANTKVPDSIRYQGFPHCDRKQDVNLPISKSQRKEQYLINAVFPEILKYALRLCTFHGNVVICAGSIKSGSL